MANDCGGLRIALNGFKTALGKAGVKTSKVLFSGKGRKKPMMFDVKKITNNMMSDIILGTLGARKDVLLDIKGTDSNPGIISNPETYKKVFKALDRAGKLNAIIQDFDDKPSTDAEKNIAGEMIKFRSVALAEVLAAIESEANIQDNIKLVDDNEIETLFNNDGSRKVNLTSVAQTVGKALAENIGFKISADPTMANYQYGKLGRIAIQSLEDAGIVRTAENDTILNNEYKDDNNKDLGRGSSKTLKGYPTVSVVLDSLLDEKDKGKEDKRANLQQALTEADSKRLESHETASETIAAISAVRRMVVPSNMLAPFTIDGEINQEGTMPDVRDLGDQNSRGITKANDDLLETLQDREQMVNPLVGKLILHMKKILDDNKKNTNISAEATLRNLYSDLGFREKDIQHQVFGSLDKTTPDNEKSKIGQAISKENPMLQLIMSADEFFNEDGTSKTYNHQLGLYRTTRMEYLSTFLNEQMDKTFSRSMVVGEAVTLNTDSAIGEKAYNDMLHSLEDDLKGGTLDGKAITIDDITGDSKNPALMALIDRFRVNFKDDVSVARQLKFIEALTKGKIGTTKEGFSLPGSVWNQISILEALTDIDDMNKRGDKKIETSYRTKPDAAASGVMLSFMQNIGKDFDDLTKDKVFDIMRRMGYTTEEIGSDEALADAYDILLKQVEAAAIDPDSPDVETLALMKELTDLGLFKAMRDIAKPMTMTTNYQAGEETAISSTSKELTETVIDKMQSGSLGAKALKFIKEKIEKNAPEFYKEKGVSAMGASTLAKTEGVNAAIEKFFTQELSTKLRHYIDEGLNPAMKKYKARINESFKHLEDVFMEGIETGEHVPLSIIPAMAWMTMEPSERDYPGEFGSKEYREHHIELLKKYGMPLTSRKQVMTETKDGTKVIITKEIPNALTASVNAIHGIDSAIFFKSHIDTIAEINQILKDNKYEGVVLTAEEKAGFTTALKNASGMIHDANNADPYYNLIYTPHYKRNSVEISSEYDVEEQLALTYMSYEGTNGSFSGKIMNEMWNGSQEKKVKKQEALKKIDKTSYRFFGFKEGKPEMKTQETVEVVPEPTALVETDEEVDMSTPFDADPAEKKLKQFGAKKTDNKSFNKLASEEDIEYDAADKRVETGSETEAQKKKRLEEHADAINDAVDYWVENSEIIADFVDDSQYEQGHEKGPFAKAPYFSYSPARHQITIPNIASLKTKAGIYAMEHEIAHMKTEGFMEANPNHPSVKAINKATENIGKYKDAILNAVGDNDFIKQRLEYMLDGEDKNVLRSELVAVLGSEKEVAKRFVEEVRKINKKDVGLASKIVIASKNIYKNAMKMNFKDMTIDPDQLMASIDNILTLGQDYNLREPLRAEKGRLDHVIRADKESKMLTAKERNRNTNKKKANPKKILEDATYYDHTEAYEKNPEASKSIVPGMRQWNTLNNYTGSITRNFMDDSLEPYLGKGIDKADEYLTKNFPVYKKNRNIITDYWNSADWLQSQKAYLDRARSGDLFALNKLETIQMNAHQEATRIHNRMINETEELLKEAGLEAGKNDEAIAELNRTMTYAPVFHLVNTHGDFKRILSSKDHKAEIEKMISEISKGISKNNMNKINKLALVLAKKEGVDTGKGSYYNIEQMKVSDGIREKVERLVALQTLLEVDGSVNGLTTLAANPKLADNLSLMSVSLKDITESMLNGLSSDHDRENFRENLIYEQFENPVEFKAVDERMLRSKEFSANKGWKTLRTPKGDTYGVIYRDRSQSTTQQGAGTTVDFRTYDIMVDSTIKGDANKVMKGATSVLTPNGTQHKVVLTQAELNKVPGLLANPADSLVRAYSQALIAKNTQSARDYIVFGGKIDQQNKATARSFDKDVNKMKPEDRPWFIKIPASMTLSEFEEAHPGTMNHYKMPENASRIDGFDQQFELVRKDMNDMLMGYKDPEFFEDNSTLRQWSHVIRQGVTMIKTHWVIVNPAKIASDAVSNNIILAAYGLPPVLALKYQRDGFRYGNEMAHLRSELVDLEFRIHSYGDKAEHAGKKKDAIKDRGELIKKIQKHPFAPMYQNGMIQSMSTEVLVKDASVVSGLQKDIEKLLNTFLKDEDGADTGIAENIKRAYSAFDDHGFDGSKMLEFAGESIGNFELLSDFGKNLGEALKDSGGRIRKKKDNGDVAKYLSEFIASPDSEAVRLGSYLVQMTDISARYALYKHLMNTRGMNEKGMKNRDPNAVGSEQEAVIKTLEAFVDYKVNMPKELKAMSDYGVILFPSFWLRIQKVIYAIAKDNPGKVALGITLSELLNLPVESYYDSNIFAKAGNVLHQPPVFTDPLDMAMPTDLLADLLPFVG